MGVKGPFPGRTLKELADKSSRRRCEGDQTEASPRFNHAVLMGRLGSQELYRTEDPNHGDSSDRVVARSWTPKTRTTDN